LLATDATTPRPWHIANAATASVGESTVVSRLGRWPSARGIEARSTFGRDTLMNEANSTHPQPNPDISGRRGALCTDARWLEPLRSLHARCRDVSERWRRRRPPRPEFDSSKYI